MSQPVLADDWQTDVSGRSVKVVNLSERDIGLGASDLNTNLRVSLLIYVNDATTDGRRWRRVTTGVLADGCLDGSDADDLCGGSPAPRETTASFPTTEEIPVGEHLLVLVGDPDGSAPSADDTPDLTQITATWSGEQFVVGRVKFFSRGGVPPMEVRVR